MEYEKKVNFSEATSHITIPEAINPPPPLSEDNSIALVQLMPPPH